MISGQARLPPAEVVWRQLALTNQGIKRSTYASFIHFCARTTDAHRKICLPACLPGCAPFSANDTCVRQDSMLCFLCRSAFCPCSSGRKRRRQSYHCYYCYYYTLIILLLQNFATAMYSYYCCSYYCSPHCVNIPRRRDNADAFT